MNLQVLKQKHDGSRFQELLANFIIEHNLRSVVETGCGVSSVFILDAMDKAIVNFDYRLFSIDPKMWFPDEINHPRHVLVEEKSVDALLELYFTQGPFDCFLHDGCHEILEQTYEYNFGFDCLKPGGYLFTDDENWGGNEAWNTFTQERGLKSFQLGSLWGVQKPMNINYCPASEAKKRHEEYLEIATKREEAWLAAGNKKHEAFS